jgi:hypothetical protein
MTQPRTRSAKGKWLAAALVVMGVVAAVVEWKVRSARISVPRPATMPVR